MSAVDKATKRSMIAAVVFLISMVALTLVALPYIKLLFEPKTQQKFISWIISLGGWGWIVVLGIQVVQIIIAFIPGEPIEILAGLLYGGFGGLLICLAGCVVASSGIFLLSKRFGTPLVAKLFRKNKLNEFVFLKDSRKLETIVFILFLIPGTPKDMLTYIVGTSPMKISKFLLISTFARIPSVISSTLIGSTMRQGKWEIVVLIFALTAGMGVLGIVYKERMLGVCKRIGRRIKDEVAERRIIP